MNGNKQLQEASLIGRFLSMEALLLLMGVVSLLYGIAKGSLLNFVCGLFIIPGFYFAIKARKNRLRHKNSHPSS